MIGLTVHAWKRDSRNPVLPPGPNSFDISACMNPFVVRKGDEYFLFYAGGCKDGHRRICLATCPVDDVVSWKRHGPLFDLGGNGAFDKNWCVLPCVHRVGDRWHLYYTGNCGDGSLGLQAFWGMGLAVSDDLLNWKKYSADPIMSGDGFPQFPANRAIAGGGRIMDMPQPAGRTLYRMHYTLPTGRPDKSVLIDQEKHSAIAHSYDGLKWFDKRIIMSPRPDADYENAATIALNIWKTPTRWRAIYAGIGTRFGAYSICEAVSEDGLTWDRGLPGHNLSLPPQGTGWESQMTEYPNVVDENGKLRLFYCGNGYGATGIGTALAEPIE